MEPQEEYFPKKTSNSLGASNNKPSKQQLSFPMPLAETTKTATQIRHQKPLIDSNNDNSLFQSVLENRKKMLSGKMYEPLPLKAIKQPLIQTLPKDKIENMIDNSIPYKYKKDLWKKDFAKMNIDHLLHSKKDNLFLETPSRRMEQYYEACKIASLLKLDPIARPSDAILIELKQRIQWILAKHRLNAVPTLSWFRSKG